MSMRLKRDPDEAASRIDEGDEDKPFWRHGRWQFAAAFLAVGVLGGLAATVFDGNDADAKAVAAGPVIGTLGPDGSRPQQCRTDDSAQAIPTEAPRDVTWWQLNGAQTPVSASAGPLKATGPLRWCFAHTPMGAVMAADVIPRQMSGSNWRAVLHQQLVPGMSRDYFEAMRASIPAADVGQASSSLAGFAVVDYTPATATIRILVRQAGPVYASVDYTVDWDGVDWRIEPLSIGGLFTNASAVDSLVGFVLWKEP